MQFREQLELLAQEERDQVKKDVPDSQRLQALYILSNLFKRATERGAGLWQGPRRIYGVVCAHDDLHLLRIAPRLAYHDTIGP